MTAWHTVRPHRTLRICPSHMHPHAERNTAGDLTHTCTNAHQQSTSTCTRHGSSKASSIRGQTRANDAPALQRSVCMCGQRRAERGRAPCGRGEGGDGGGGRRRAKGMPFSFGCRPAIRRTSWRPGSCAPALPGACSRRGAAVGRIGCRTAASWRLGNGGPAPPRPDETHAFSLRPGAMAHCCSARPAHTRPCAWTAGCPLGRSGSGWGGSAGCTPPPASC
mmetsp:Transcript_71574/g.119905  ORF Transcript_71574/g.119905 Transcript_71574/m.119905 type:complete len:221 (-) Transcript_71574:1522-2184(-)